MNATWRLYDEPLKQEATGNVNREIEALDSI
jgi:hypothetical protein